uniref:Uncharacterized protein n=1 Tax=Panagrolaimus davidi TaxID=227884 RepID=A0A914NZ35_9BILA
MKIFANEDNEGDDDEPFDISSTGIGTEDYDAKKFVDLVLAQKQDPEKLLKMFRAIFLKEYDHQHEETIKFFKPIISSALNDDYLPGQKQAIRSVELLVENDKFQHIEKDVIKSMIQKFMLSDDISISVKTLETLAKIISKNPKFRDLALSFNIDDKLFEYMNKKSAIRPEISPKIAAVIKSLCTFGDKKLPEKTITKLLWIIEYFLKESKDPEIIKNSTWAYWFLTKPPTSRQYFILEEIVKNQIEFLEHEDFELKLVILGVIEAIFEREKPDQTQMYLSNGFLSKLPKLLEENNDDLIIQEVLVIVGKLIKTSKDTSEDSTTAIHEAGIPPNVVKNIFHEKFVIQDAATLATCYIISSSNEAQISDLIDANVVNGLCHFFKLTETEDRYVFGVLEGLQKILKKAEKRVKEVYKSLDECDGIKVLQRLKYRRNKSIGDQSEEILQVLEKAMQKENQVKSEL